MEKYVEEVTLDSARKRKAQPANWKRNVQKRLRYSAKALPEMPACSHRGHLTCRLLKIEDIRRFHKAFYDIPTKNHQDKFICKYVSSSTPKRKRQCPNKSLAKKPKTASYEYFIENLLGNRMTVCRETFLKVLGVTKHRVFGVFKNFKQNDGALVPTETRGGWRKENIYASKRESVINFIKGFKGIESHYSRAKSNRLYLPSELSISKMFQMYNEIVDFHLEVKETFFRNIFETKFNLSFSNPTTDECSTCIELKDKIKRETNSEMLTELKLKLQIHLTKAKCFFDFLRKKPDSCMLMSFDCQKNLVLPKVSDQSAYYSRQLYCYNLSVVTGVSTDKLDPSTVSIYTWTENEGKKGSNEVASVVFNELCTNRDLSEYSSVRLVADGCATQNKNINILAMVSTWFSLYAPPCIKEVELIFPVTGHSYMPADRVFGQLEKKLKKHKTIINVSEYHDIFMEHGKLKVLGKDWQIYDWKSEASEILKSPAQLHFHISQIKRLILTKGAKNKKIYVRGELGYSVNTGVAKTIEKKGKSIQSMNPNQIDVGVKVNENKIKDVDKLLGKHFGTEWRTIECLKWYKNVIEVNNPEEKTVETGGGIENDDGDDGCECLDPSYEGDEEIYCGSQEDL